MSEVPVDVIVVGSLLVLHMYIWYIYVSVAMYVGGVCTCRCGQMGWGI